MQVLFTNGKTAEKITGFVSKAGNSFDAYLKYADEKIQFDFDEQGASAVESTPPAPQPWLDTASESDEYWESLMSVASEEPRDMEMQ